MSSRKTLKSVSVEGLKPTITLTPVIEQCGEGYRIQHIKSDSIARDGRDTFVPLRHVLKQKRRIFELEEENAKLREQMEQLVTLLRVDYDIDASWDGLRRFWNIGLTDDGCLMRDRACKTEAENAKLRELLQDVLPFVEEGFCCCPSSRCWLYDESKCDAPVVTCEVESKTIDRMRELGI